MRTARTARPALHLVTPLEHEPAVPLVSFCSHCGARPAPPPAESSASHSRVCASCGLGLILECRADVAPSNGAAFLVLDHSLAVCAVSEAAERLLAATEPDVVNRHVSDLLMPADAEGKAGGGLSSAVAWAARGDEATRIVVVRPANTFGIRLTARIASCGPPRAALLVLE
jgi:hypothetical protein